MLWTAVLALIICIVLWKMAKKEHNDLAHLPGPPRWPIIGNALGFIGHTPDELFSHLIELPKKYGNRVVIQVFSRYILHVYSVDDIEIVLSHSKNIKKNKPYSFIEPWLGTGLLISSGNKWHRRRKTLTPTFHFDILKSFMRVFQEKSRNAVEHLKRLVEKDRGVVDVMPFISDFTLYTICETAMGIKLDSDKSEATLKYKDAIMEIGPLIMKRLTAFWLHNNFIFNMLPIGKMFVKCLEKVHRFADDVIMERQKAYRSDGGPETEVGSKRRLAFLDLLLEAEINGEIDLEGIREEVNTFMFEGHDTTATALTFGLMLLADHEEVQERIFEECSNMFGDSDRAPDVADLAEMKYLDAVIKEILRLYPSVPFIGREIVEDFTLDGIEVKKGYEVVVHIYDVHRRPDLYLEPEAFRPERFLGGESRHPFAYIPFSAGPRNCIGQRFARMELKCVLSDIIRNFRLKPLKKGARPTLRADLVLRPTGPIYVQFVLR